MGQSEKRGSTVGNKSWERENNKTGIGEFKRKNTLRHVFWQRADIPVLTAHFQGPIRSLSFLALPRRENLQDLGIKKRDNAYK